MPEIKAYKSLLIDEEKTYFVYRFSVDGEESPAVMLTSEELTDEQVMQKIIDHLENPEEAEKLGPRQ